MNTSLSIFARALATENLSFAFDAKADTASFDTKNRHLTLPVWDVSETVQTMLIAHEISHALWTPYQESEDILAAAEQEGYHKGLLQRIANMVEDVRIEKMMKQKYPGTRRDFFLGYKEIHTSDMFGFSKMDFSKMGLINRLNTHFKWGVPGFMDLNLSDEEQKIAAVIDGVEKFADVYRVAKMLYDHPSMQDAVQQAEQELAAAKGNGNEEQRIMDAIAGDSTGGIGKKDGEVYTSSTVTIPEVKDYSKSIITTDFILSKFDALTVASRDNQYPQQPLDLAPYREFVRNSDAFVRQLVAQFERKKAADEIRRDRPKQTGMLNLDRLHQFRTHDDIFLTKIVKQEGKNHGIVFVLDMSGSMSRSLADCFLQVLQLVWFCEKAKIPFEVFGFTEVHPVHLMGHDEYRKEQQKFNNDDSDVRFFPESLRIDPVRSNPTNILHGNTKLINLASSRDDAAKRERLLAYLYGAWVAGTSQRPGCLSLSGTPTVEALSLASQFIRDWVTAQDIQIPTVMLVTDGQPNGVYTENDTVSAAHWHQGQGTLTVMNEIYGTAHRISLKDHPYTCMGNLALYTMLDSMRQKINARCVGMFVDSHNLSPNAFITFCMSTAERTQFENMQGRYSNEVIEKSPRFIAMKEAYRDGAILCHPDSVPGYDSFFVVKTPKVVKDEDAIAESGTFTKIKNTFVKTMAKRSGSRVFLTRYVDIVAGQKIGKDIGGEYNHALFAQKR
jgi:hypothetical protein